MLDFKGMNQLAENEFFSQSKPGQSLQNEPLGFIDIGARGGAHDLVEPIAKHTAVLGFECDQAECMRLMQNPCVYQPWAQFHLETTALAQAKGQAELKLLSLNTNHSLLYPNEAFTKRYRMDKWEVVGKEMLDTDTLDNILFKQLSGPIHFGEFMKLDTQGTEYEILQGSLKTLSERTVAIMTEVAFCELYQGQKLFSDVETLLRQNGFSFYGFTSLHTRSKKYLDKKSHVTRERLIYTDAIFFKDPLGGGYTNELSMRQNFVLFTVACLLGYYDFAYELARNTWLMENDSEEVMRIENLIKTLANLPTDKTEQELLCLLNAVKQNPDWANVTVGGFIDKRRAFCDYDDVLNISPLPKSL